MDPRRVKVHRTPATRDVPYVPSDDNVVMAMLRLAAVTPADTVFDLGCGDGRICFAAAKHFGARAVGVDIDPDRIEECRDHLHRAPPGLAARVSFHLASLFDVDLRPCTVLCLYLLPGVNARLRPKLLADLPTGARVVCNHFELGDWRPDQTVEAHHRRLHRYVVPAPVTGDWKCTVSDRDGRRHVRLHLERRYQVVTGRIHVAGRDVPIADGRIAGDRLSFRAVEWGRQAQVMRYVGRIDGPHVRGRCWEDGREHDAGEWGGERTG